MAAPEVQVNDWVQVNLIGLYDGQTTIYTHLFFVSEASAPGAELGLDQVADHFLEVWWTAVGNTYRKLHVMDFQLVNVQAQILSPIRSIAWPATPDNAESFGSVAEDGLPTGAAVVMRRKGLIGDRHNYGRVYLSGVPAAWITQSRVNDAFVAQYDALEDTQETDETVTGTGGNFTLQPFILRKDNIPQSRRVAFGQLDRIVRYQRRREVGVGI